MTDKTARSGCAKVLVAGCLAVVVLLVAGATLIALNWSKIEEFARSATETMGDLLELQRAVAAAYPAEALQVQSMHQSGESQPVLVLKFVNPAFLASIPEDQYQDKAREIAAFAYEAHASPDELAGLQVNFVSQKRVGLTFTSTQGYLFTIEELRAEAETEAPAPEP